MSYVRAKEQAAGGLQLIETATRAQAFPWGVLREIGEGGWQGEVVDSEEREKGEEESWAIFGVATVIAAATLFVAFVVFVAMSFSD